MAGIFATTRGVAPSEVSNTSSSARVADISNLKPGDSFQGEIVSVNGQDVSLFLGASGYLNARLEGQIQLSLGQNLLFQVQSNKDSKIVLKPVYDENSQQHVHVAALKAAGLGVTDKNLDIVAKLLENGMPIDKKAISNMHRLMLQNPTVAPDTLVKMTKLHLPVTEENVRQFENYNNFKGNLSVAVDDVSKEIMEIYDKLSKADAQNGTSTASTFMRQIVDLVKSEQTLQSQDSQSATTQLNQGLSTATPESAVNVTNNAQQLASQNIQNLPNSQSTQPQTTEVTIDQQPLLNTQADAQTVTQTIQQTAIQSPDSQTAMSMPDGQSTNNVSLTQNEAASWDVQMTQNQTATSDMTVQVGEQGVKSPQILAGEQVLQHQKGLNPTLLEDESTITSRKLGDAIKDLWSLEPEDIAKPDEVKRLYQRISRDAKALEEIISKAMENDMSAGRSVQNLRSNIDFMNQINQIFQYVQLPLKFNGRNANGDLYVYTNKRNLAKGGDNLTALLHLDMDNLGMLDVRLSLQTTRSMLTMQFFMQDEMVDFMREHQNELVERLEKLGYRVNSTVDTLKEERNTIKELETFVTGSSTPMTYQAFDIRA